MNHLIASRTNPTVLRLLSYKENPSEDAFLVEGYHLLEMAYEAGLLVEAYGTKQERYGSVPFTLISDSVLSKLCVSKSPEGVVGVARLPKGKVGYGDKVLLLDRVQDPGNVGTLLRSALSFGYHDVILLPECASPLKSKVIAASQGALFRLRLHFMEPSQIEKLIADEKLPLVGTALMGATALSEFKMPSRHILALGNEGQGLSAQLLALSSQKVKIEMEGIDSLNVAIAGSILMYEFSRRQP